MTIPFAIPFGRRRLVMSFDLVSAPQVAPLASSGSRRTADVPAAYDATDAELARLNTRSAAVEDRIRWEMQATLHGLRT